MKNQNLKIIGLKLDVKVKVKSSSTDRQGQEDLMLHNYCSWPPDYLAGEFNQRHLLNNQILKASARREQITQHSTINVCRPGKGSFLQKTLQYS